MADKTIVIRIALKSGQFIQGMNQAGAATQQFAVDVSRGAERAGGSVQALGTAAAFAGKAMLLGIGGAMAVSAQAAIQFESSLAGVAKTVDFTGSRFDAAADPIRAFGEVLRDMSLDIPLNVNELARIAEVGGQLGVEADNLQTFTETMAALGVSTNLSAEEAATGLARFANIMGTPQDEFDMLGSVIVELGNNLATTESEILTFGTRIAAVGQTVGASEEEVLALAGALSSLGIPAERGGTAVQRVLIQMKQAVDDGGASLEQFGEVAGMTGEKFREQFLESPGRAFESFVRGLQRINDQGGSTFRTLDQLELDAVRTTQVLLAAAGGADVLSESLNRAEQEAEDQNALWEEAARRYGTTESQIRLVANAFNDLRIEVGDMLLGTGGLAAALDWAKEFFGIVKENLGLVKGFITLLGGLVALKIALWFANAAGAAVKLARDARNAAGAMKALQLAGAGLNLLTLGVAAVGVGLVAMFANAAREAAELKRIASDVINQIDEGVDVAKAFVDALSGGSVGGGAFGWGDIEIGSTEFQDSLRRLTGLSMTQFVDQMLKGGDVLDIVADNLGVTREELENLDERMRSGKGVGSVLDPELQAISGDLRNIIDYAGEATDAIEAVRATRRGQIVDALLEAGSRTSVQELEQIADNLIRINGLSLTAEEAVAKVMQPPPDLLATNRAVRTWRENIDTSQMHYLDFLASLEDGEKIIENWRDTISDAADGFRESMADAFEAVTEEITAGFPAWDEYEQKATVAIQGVIDAQDAFLEDMTAWGNVQKEIAGDVSDEVFDYLNALDPATKGALARLFRTNRDEFDRFITEISANFDELDTLIEQRWFLELPSATKEAFRESLGILGEQISLMNLNGQQQAQAWADGFQALLRDTGWGGAIEDAVFSDFEIRRAIFNTLGMELGGELLAGIIAGMQITPTAQQELKDANDRLIDEIKDNFQITSPSKVTFQIGRQLMEGMTLGIQSLLPDTMRVINQITPSSIPIPQPPNVTVSTPPTSKNAEVHIHNPSTRDLNKDLSYAATLAGLMSEVGG